MPLKHDDLSLKCNDICAISHALNTAESKLDLNGCFVANQVEANNGIHCELSSLSGVNSNL